MRKIKTLALLMAFIILFSTLTVSAKTEEKRSGALNGIIINDHIVYSEVEPYIKNDRTCVPIRFIAEELGYKVEWNKEERKAIMSNEGTTVEIKIDSDQMLVNGKAVKIEAPAEITKDRTFVPLRAISEAFGEKVDYSKEYRLVFLGENPKYDNFYKVVYYYEKLNPVISTDKVNIAKNQMDLGGEVTTFKSLAELIDALYEDFNLYKAEEAENKPKLGLETYKEIEAKPKEEVKEEAKDKKTPAFETTVAKENQLIDGYYIAPTSDPLVGTWYGEDVFVSFLIDDYYETKVYRYIESLGDNKYKMTTRTIVASDPGSEYWLAQNFKYNEKTKTLELEEVKKAYKRTGIFKEYNFADVGGTVFFDEANMRIYWEKIGSDFYCEKF